MNIIKTFLVKYQEESVEKMNEYIRKYGLSYYAFRYYLKFKGRENEIPKLIKMREKEQEFKGTYLNKEQIVEAIDKLPNKYRVIAYIQFLTGARIREVLTIRKENVSLEGDFLRIKIIGKGQKERYIFIPLRYDFIVRYLKDSPFAYPFLEDNIVDARRINNVYTLYYIKLNEVFSLIGVKFRPHDFRRNFITFVYQKTQDIVKTKNLVGHEKIETTYRYLNKMLSQEELKKIVQEL